MHYIVVHSGALQRTKCGGLEILRRKISVILGYNNLVRVKTSITLPDDLLKTIDRAGGNRSAFLERAARAYLAGLERAKREARDVAIIDAHADRLNKEAMDVLDYQGLP
jgi:hypothetical protein